MSSEANTGPTKRRSRWADIATTETTPNTEITIKSEDNIKIEPDNTHDKKVRQRWGDLPPTDPSQSIVQTVKHEQTSISTMSDSIKPIVQPLPSQISSGLFIQSLNNTPDGKLFYHRYKEHLIPFTDSYLDQIFPPGFKVVPQPPEYIPPTLTEMKLASKDLPTGPVGFTMHDTSSSMGGLYPSSGDSFDELDIFSNIPPEIADLPLDPTDLVMFKPMFDPQTSQKEKDVYITLFKIKNASGPVRKAASRRLIRNPSDHPAPIVFPIIVQILTSADLTQIERHFLNVTLTRLMTAHGIAVKPYISQIIQLTTPLLMNNDKYIQSEGGDLIRTLTRCVGLAPVISTIRTDVISSEAIIRNGASRLLAQVATVVGIGALLPFLKILINSGKVTAIETSLRIIQQSSILLGISILPYMDDLLDAIIPCFASQHSDIVTYALLACDKILSSCTTHFCDSASKVAAIIAELIQSARRQTLVACVRCVTSLLSSMPGTSKTIYWPAVSQYILGDCFSIGDSTSLIVCLDAISMAIKTKAITNDDIIQTIVPFVFENLCSVRVCSDFRATRSVKSLFVNIANKVGASILLTEQMLMLLQHENSLVVSSVATFIAAISVSVGLSDISPTTERRLINLFLERIKTTLYTERELFNDVGTEQTIKLNISSSVYSAIAHMGTYSTDPLLISFSAIYEVLGPRNTQYSGQIVGTSYQLISDISPSKSYTGAVLLSRIIALTYAPSPQLLETIWNHIDPYLTGANHAIKIAALLCTLNELIKRISSDNLFSIDGVPGPTIASQLSPSPTEMMTKITPMLSNPHPCVSLVSLLALCNLGRYWGDITPGQEWLRIVGLHTTQLLRHSHRTTRTAVVALTAVAANIIGAADVLLKLMPALIDTNRGVRVGITSAIGAITQVCGVTTVLPLLMHSYQIATERTSLAIMKACVVCVQHARSEGHIIATALYPLIKHSLTNKSSKIVRIGLQLCIALILSTQNEIQYNIACFISSYVAPYRAINSHLNMWWYEWRRLAGALSKAIGGGFIRVLLTGMFHPARRVRENHWVWYNTLAHHKQQSLPMHIPQISYYNDLLGIDRDSDPYLPHSLMLPF